MKIAGNERIDRPENHSGNGVRAVFRWRVRKVNGSVVFFLWKQAPWPQRETRLSPGNSLQSAQNSALQKVI
jgi:hypothetical protein